MDRAVVELNDYEVLGIGAQRKQDLINRQDEVEYVLKTHAHPRFLPGVYEHTLEWLQPARVEKVSELEPRVLLESCFYKMFPLGVELLGDSAAKLLHDYLKEMPWEEGLLEDHFRYFAFFVRTRLPQNTLWMEVFLWEWIQSSLTYLDFSDRPSTEKNILKTNPSLITLQIVEAKAVLKRDRGLYAYVYSPRQNKVVEKQLNVLDAEILDLLSEDRKFSKQQIADMLKEENVANSDEVFGALDSLLQSDIITVTEI